MELGRGISPWWDASFGHDHPSGISERRGKAFACVAVGRRSAATWEEGTLVYPGFNFLRHLPGHLISSKQLDFPLAWLVTAGLDLSWRHSITHATSPVSQYGARAKRAQWHTRMDRPLPKAG